MEHFYEFHSESISENNNLLLVLNLNKIIINVSFKNRESSSSKVLYIHDHYLAQEAKYAHSA